MSHLGARVLMLLMLMSHLGVPVLMVLHLELHAHVTVLEGWLTAYTAVCDLRS
jgi:hypothetical protein